MLNYIFSGGFLLVGIIALIYARSYNFILKSTEQNVKLYADKLKKMLNMGGFISIACALLLFAIILLKRV